MSGAQTHKRKAENDIEVCVLQEEYSCLIVNSIIKSYERKYLTYRLVSDGSGGGNPTPET
jgi:hypothetical protein